MTMKDTTHKNYNDQLDWVDEALFDVEPDDTRCQPDCTDLNCEECADIGHMNAEDGFWCSPAEADATPDDTHVRYTDPNYPGNQLEEEMWSVITEAQHPDDPWVMIGRYFGYPECCIRAFCNLEHLQPGAMSPSLRPHFGTGFIPCDSCCTLNHDSMVAHINARRLCITAFPDQGGFTLEAGQMKVCESMMRRDGTRDTNDAIDQHHKAALAEDARRKECARLEMWKGLGSRRADAMLKAAGYERRAAQIGDGLTRSVRDDLAVEQIKGAWPNPECRGKPRPVPSHLSAWDYYRKRVDKRNRKVRAEARDRRCLVGAVKGLAFMYLIVGVIVPAFTGALADWFVGTCVIIGGVIGVLSALEQYDVDSNTYWGF